MPKDQTHFTPSNWCHHRQHSSLCPKNVTDHDRKGSAGSYVQLLAGDHAEALGHHEDKCDCETVIPQEDLGTRYGLVEEPDEIRRKRDSLDRETASQLAEIVNQELMSDMEARQCMI